MWSSRDSAEEFTSKKRSQLLPSSSTKKSAIYNSYTSTLESAPEVSISDMVKQTVSTSGEVEASVYRIFKELKCTE